MGAVNSLWKKETVEQALEKLESKITKLEYRQRTSHLSRRRITSSLILYSFFIEGAIAVWYYFYSIPLAPLKDKLIRAAPLLLFPLLVYFLKYAIAFYYSRRIVSDEAQLVKLRELLKTKLDERKKATDFDNTQKLLNKYEKLAETKEHGKDEAVGGPRVPSTPTKPPNVNEAQQSKVLSPQGSDAASSLRHRAVQQQQQQQQQPGVQQQPQQAQSHPPAQVQNILPPDAAQQNSGWMNRLVDYLLGTGPQYGFALICTKCSSHNGLAPPSEIGTIQFRCRNCNHLNECSPEAPKQQKNRVTRSQTVANIVPNLPEAQPQQQQQQEQQHKLMSLKALGKSQSFSNSPQISRDDIKGGS